MKLTQEQIAELKAFCVEHYNDPKHSYDTFVECYEDKDWHSLAADVRNMRELKSLMKSIASAWRERERECW